MVAGARERREVRRSCERGWGVIDGSENDGAIGGRTGEAHHGDLAMRHFVGVVEPGGCEGCLEVDSQMCASRSSEGGSS